jgi:hypothetical protein
MNEEFSPAKILRRRIRRLLWIVFVGLFLSGATALPLNAEVSWLSGLSARVMGSNSAVALWLGRVHEALHWADSHYPFLSYGTDWLAFGHFAIAIAFLGPLRDPVKNIWVVEFGIIAALLVPPFALTMGEWRGIPLWWRGVDAFFGVATLLLLVPCRRMILRLASLDPR